MKAKLAIHYLQSKFCLNFECLVESDTSSMQPVIPTEENTKNARTSDTITKLKHGDVLYKWRALSARNSLPESKLTLRHEPKLLFAEIEIKMYPISNNTQTAVTNMTIKHILENKIH